MVASEGELVSTGAPSAAQMLAGRGQPVVDTAKFTRCKMTQTTAPMFGGEWLAS